MHALRTLLGGLRAKEKTPEAVAHLVQDNWNKGAFAWRRALVEHIFDFFKRGADWLNISEHKFRLSFKWPARRRQVSGDKTRPEADTPALHEDKQVPLHAEQGDSSAIPRSRFGRRGT